MSVPTGRVTRRESGSTMGENSNLQKLVSEAIGTALLVFIGDVITWAGPFDVAAKDSISFSYLATVKGTFTGVCGGSSSPEIPIHPVRSP